MEQPHPERSELTRNGDKHRLEARVYRLAKATNAKTDGLIVRLKRPGVGDRINTSQDAGRILEPLQNQALFNSFNRRQNLRKPLKILILGTLVGKRREISTCFSTSALEFI